MPVIKVNNRNMIHSSSPNKCITRTKMRVLTQFPNTAQILSGGSSVALVEVISSLSPSSGQVVKLPLCPDHISSPCHSDLQQSVSHSSSSDRSQPRGVSLSWCSVCPRLAYTPVQGPGSSCFLFSGCWRAVRCRSPLRVREHFPGPNAQCQFHPQCTVPVSFSPLGMEVDRLSPSHISTVSLGTGR